MSAMDYYERRSVPISVPDTNKQKDDAGKEYVVYNIYLASRHTASRRYREFDALHTNVSTQCTRSISSQSSQYILSVYPLSISSQYILSVFLLSISSQCILSVYPLSISSQYILSVYPLSVSSQYILSVYPLSPLSISSQSSQYILSVYPLSISSQYILSVYPLSIASQYILSVYPLMMVQYYVAPAAQETVQRLHLPKASWEETIHTQRCSDRHAKERA